MSRLPANLGATGTALETTPARYPAKRDLVRGSTLTGFGRFRSPYRRACGHPFPCLYGAHTLRQLFRGLGIHARKPHGKYPGCFGCRPQGRKKLPASPGHVPTGGTTATMMRRGDEKRSPLPKNTGNRATRAYHRSLRLQSAPLSKDSGVGETRRYRQNPPTDRYCLSPLKTSEIP